MFKIGDRVICFKKIGIIKDISFNAVLGEGVFKVQWGNVTLTNVTEREIVLANNDSVEETEEMRWATHAGTVAASASAMLGLFTGEEIDA